MQAQENRVGLDDEEQLLFITGGQDNAVDNDVDEPPVQDLALNVDNVFQADECDAFDIDVDEALTSQTLFMANLSSTDPVYDEAGPHMIRTLYLRKGCATWDGGNSTWGGRARVFGTVLVCVRVQERAGGEGWVLAGRFVKGALFRRYPLSKFTLEQLVNVARLQVDEKSEMSLELLRFTRQQLQEYQQG
nr:integrase, catalytic region, zinc finger, CCHC-type, peptidase aspartic, catalytic [Tanacetum cinerariifolium]